MDFETIYRRYFRDVYLYIRSLTADNALAEEIAQETFYRAKGMILDYMEAMDDERNQL